MRKPIGNATARVQRMMLKLQRYALNIVPGKNLVVADALLRAYMQGKPDRVDRRYRGDGALFNPRLSSQHRQVGSDQKRN